MKYPIIDIEGIGEVYKDKLIEVGIKNTMTYLERTRTPKHREMLAAETGIGDKLILEWANLADLMRVNGVGEEYADLLEEAGVDTVKELRTRNPENLYTKIIEVNDEKELVRRPPGEEDIRRWIDDAKEIDPMLEY